MKILPTALALASVLAFSSEQAAAQGAPSGWSSFVDGLVVYQDDADLDDGGSFSASRSFLRGGGLYRDGSGFSAGVSVSVGRLDYDFSLPGNTPWGDINDLRVAVPLAWRLENEARVLVVPQLRWDYESGANASDGLTGGVFAGIAWQVSDDLRIGPALGAFSQLEDDVEVFPALLVDWQIADRWNLRTGTAPGATQGPGLSLGFDVTDAFSLSLGARYEKLRFRLDGAGPAPNGVGEDRSVPVVLSLAWRPNPAVSLNVFAGAEFGGEMRLYDASGAEISRQGYDTAPTAGFAFRILF